MRRSPAALFGEAASLYDRARPSYPAELVDAAVALATGTRVVEVGCGTGQLTELLTARGLEVDAVEPSPEMAALARRRAPVAKLHVAPFEDVELPHAPYDALFSASAFHWVDPHVGWEKAARLLRPGAPIALLAHMTVYEPDDDEESLLDVFRELIPGLPWTPRDARTALAAIEAERENVSAAWAAADGGGAVPEARRLFGEPRLLAVPWTHDYDTQELLDFLRTTATYLSFEVDGRARFEACIRELVERLGGSLRRSYLAVLVAASRR